MLRTVIVSIVLVATASYQQAPPATDVFLASFALRDGKALLTEPINISNSPGYDNQPSFTPDGAAVLFTSVRGKGKPDPANSAASGSDIYRYDIASGNLAQVTDTPESEYSPTVMPDGKGFSVVRVEADGTQRLWRFPIGVGEPRLLLPDVQPVGYHAWIDADRVAVFVLGRPATLQVATLSTGKAQTVASEIGRSLGSIPGGGISYVKRGGDAEKPAVVMRLEPETLQSTALVPIMPGRGDHDIAWSPDGILLTAHEGTLYGWRRGQQEFVALVDLAALAFRDVTRMAVSPGGDRIALVASAGPGGM